MFIKKGSVLSILRGNDIICVFLLAVVKLCYAIYWYQKQVRKTFSIKSKYHFEYIMSLTYFEACGWANYSWAIQLRAENSQGRIWIWYSTMRQIERDLKISHWSCGLSIDKGWERNRKKKVINLERNCTYWGLRKGRAFPNFLTLTLQNQLNRCCI